MTKVDFKKTLKHLYQPPRKDFVAVDVPPLQFLMIDGAGDPNTSPAYQAAVETLYAVAYAAKFISKRELERDYVVPPLEGLWWAEDMAAFTLDDKSNWQWTMLIMQPEWITAAIVAQAVEQARAKKNPPALDTLRLDTYHEGLCLQIMHVGSYADEAPILARLHHEVIPNNGYVEAGKHHEIYLSDPRKTAPEKLKTVLRQPVALVAEAAAD